MTICHGKGAQWGGRGSDPLQQCLMRIKNTTGGCPNGSIPYAGRHTYSPDVWTALNNLPQRVGALLKKYESSNAGGFEDFERELHALFAQTQCAVTEEALARHDVDLPFVFIGGERYRRACRCAQTYLTATGAVSVTRTLYRARRGERAVAALERKVGIVEGYWTPLAARQGAMLVSHMTPRDAEEVLATLGHMQPSKSSLDRLPKALSARWEAQRETFEATVREATVEVPDVARAVVVSLDGVMAPMRGRYREAGCATVSLVDGDGQRLHSVRLGRMPESHKATLKTMVAAEVEAVVGQRPDLTVVNYQYAEFRIMPRVVLNWLIPFASCLVFSA